jgi:hypothetical protein
MSRQKEWVRTPGLPIPQGCYIGRVCLGRVIMLGRGPVCARPPAVGSALYLFMRRLKSERTQQTNDPWQPRRVQRLESGIGTA